MPQRSTHIFCVCLLDERVYRDIELTAVSHWSIWRRHRGGVRLRLRPCLRLLLRPQPRQAEPKWDGWRALAMVQDGHALIMSRNGRDLTRGFYGFVQALFGALPITPAGAGYCCPLCTRAIPTPRRAALPSQGRF